MPHRLAFVTFENVVAMDLRTFVDDVGAPLHLIVYTDTTVELQRHDGTVATLTLERGHPLVVVVEVTDVVIGVTRRGILGIEWSRDTPGASEAIDREVMARFGKEARLVRVGSKDRFLWSG